ncbi:hypothetical protein EYF80_056581 [Liparis tanakae]|uniref:Uncharacterized protein n=1 Tax=Liparis tanakae TaxID=230148 RepID=A0A4Z2EWS9_9TELE|nr:hypothetical protein EYF80_056581 [Liparis tanakae]
MFEVLETLPLRGVGLLCLLILMSGRSAASAPAFGQSAAAAGPIAFGSPGAPGQGQGFNAAPFGELREGQGAWHPGTGGVAPQALRRRRPPSPSAPAPSRPALASGCRRGATTSGRSNRRPEDFSHGAVEAAAHPANAALL